MQNLWGNLIPQIYKTDGAKATAATEAFDAEFEAFCAEQKKIKAEREAKKQAEENRKASPKISAAFLLKKW